VGPVPCQSVAGATWTSIYDGRTFSLSQDGAGNITGITGNSYKGSCQAFGPVTSGHFNGGGSFSITVTNPSPGDPNCIASWFTFSGTVSSAGCDRVTGDFVNDWGSGDDEWTKGCDVPTGEMTSSSGWADFSIYGAFPTVHRWRQTLSGAVNFGGRNVNETFNPGTDSCWISGSPYGYYSTPPSWNTWPVGSVDGAAATNQWGNDYVGWFPDAVNWYRTNRPPNGFPVLCGVTWSQRMNISCTTGGTVFYQGNFMAAQIDTSSVSSARSSESATRLWP
jgi:hypothetical protein